MPLKVIYVHTNLTARDGAKLAAFYQTVFGCAPVVVDQVYRGDWLNRMTGLPAPEIRVTHLRLPGSDSGPTLEIIQYTESQVGQPPASNRPGWGHLAFAVEDVPQMVEAVLAAGGGTHGEIVSADLPGRGTITTVYVTDPEGNLIELQHWA